MEFGMDIDRPGRPLLRPWITLGMAWRPDAKFDPPAAIVGSLPQAGTYTQSTRVDRTSPTVAAGFDVIKARAYSISLG
jgi:hypothetical protein